MLLSTISTFNTFLAAMAAALVIGAASSLLPYSISARGQPPRAAARLPPRSELSFIFVVIPSASSTCSPCVASDVASRRTSLDHAARASYPARVRSEPSAINGLSSCRPFVFPPS
ncbi:unnamed protein product [Closterium sp. NIES-54]